MPLGRRQGNGPSTGRVYAHRAAGRYGCHWDLSYLSPALPMGAGGPSKNPTWFSFRNHEIGANVIFCDGHLEFSNRKRADPKDEMVRRRWNNDNEPHSEYWP